MQKSKDMVTSQLPKVTCYNKAVKKEILQITVYIYIISNTIDIKLTKHWCRRWWENIEFMIRLLIY